MPKYNIIYEIVETYDATLEGDFGYYSLRKALEDGHYNGDLDRSWINGKLRVIDFKEITDEG